MDAMKPAKLARIRNRQTLYEVVAINGGETRLVVYCGRSKAKFWRSLSANDSARGKRLAALCNAERMHLINHRPDTGTIGMLGVWRICYSGRTEREAISEGEHPCLPHV